MSITRELKSKITLAHSLRLAAEARARYENYDTALDIFSQIEEIESPHLFDESKANLLFRKLQKTRVLAKERILGKSRRHYQINLNYMNTQSFSNGLLFNPGACVDFFSVCNPEAGSPFGSCRFLAWRTSSFRRRELPASAGTGSFQIGQPESRQSLRELPVPYTHLFTGQSSPMPCM
jgi:hypothetical protein